MVDSCFHSMIVDGCYSCAQGCIARQEDHIQRLRQMLRDAGAGPALDAHDLHWFGYTEDTANTSQDR